MKLDKDLMRDILLAVEADPEPSASHVVLNLPAYPADVVSYHVMLLAEGGFLIAMDVSSKGSLEWYPKRLTYDGYEFLATIRDGDVWGKTKAAAGKVGGASVAFVWELAKAEVKTKLGLG